MTHARFALPTLLLALLAACGSAPPSEPATPLASARLTLVIPAPQSGKLGTQYVSSATRSVKVTIDADSRTFDAGAGQPNCSGSAPVICTFTLSQIAAPGPHAFSVSAYSGPGATGSLLGSFGPETHTLAAGTDNALSFTLSAIVNGVQLNAVTADPQDQAALAFYLLSPGTPRGFSAVQYDAAGQVISGPGTPALYACSSDPGVTVSADDHAGHFTLSTTASGLTDVPVNLQDQPCATSPAPTPRTVLHAANAVALTLDASSALPGGVTGPVGLQDAGGHALPNLTVRGSSPLAPGSYTLIPQVINSGINRYTPGAASVPVTLTLGTPHSETLAFSAAVHASFAVTVSTTTPLPTDSVTVTAQLRDASDSALAQSGVTVTWSSAGGGSFSAPSSVTDASGKATVSFTPNPAVGSVQTVTASATLSGAAASGTSPSIVTQGPPSAVNDGPSPTSAPGDPYHVALNAPLTSYPKPGLLANDNLGGPLATISSFGGGTLGGSVTDHPAGSTVTVGADGALTVNADGSLSFKPATGFVGTVTFSYRLANSAGHSDASVTLAVGVRPAAQSDTYPTTVVGNVPINTAKSSNFTVLANDAGSNLSVTPTTVTSAHGGSATLAADGHFSYTPAAGYTGPDSFSYTASNGLGSVTATVNLTVAGRVWFIDASKGAGDGRQNTPFNSLAAFQAASSQPGDSLFLASGNYSGPLTLKDTQQLVGAASVGSLTLPADSTPPASGAAPTISATGNDLTLGQNNSLSGVNLGNASGSALSGNNFGTLSVSGVGISTTGQALNLATGTLSGSFSALSSSGGANNVLLSNVSAPGGVTLGAAGDALSGASGEAFKATGGGGTFTYPGSVANSASRAVNISGSSATWNFTGAINPAAAGNGVLLQNNTNGSVNFSGPILINAGAASGFDVSGGGSVTATGAGSQITTTSGTAVSVVNSTIGAAGLTFQSVSANGAANGIVLVNTGAAGGLSVTGLGAAGSGGTIQNSTGADGAQQGNGVYLSNTANASLKWMNLSNHQNNAVYGAGVRGLTLDHLNTSGNNGSSPSGTFEESSVHLVDLGGTVSVTNSTFNGGAFDGFLVRNTSGTNPTLNLTFSGNTISQMQGSLADVRNTAFQVIAGDGTANVSALNNTITYWWGNGMQVIVQGTASGTAAIRGNTVQNTSGALAGAGGIWINGGNLTYDVAGNAVSYTNGTAISVTEASNLASNLQGFIQNNTIGVAGVDKSGSAAGSGIFVGHLGAGTSTVNVRNNTLRETNGTTAVTVQIGDAAAAGGNGRLNATVTGNSITQPGSDAAANAGLLGLYLNIGTVTGDAHTACLDVSSNSITNFGQNRIRPNERFLTTTYLPGYTGANNDNTAISNYFLGRNPGTLINLNNNVSAGGGGYQNTPGGAACPQPNTLP